MCAASDVVKQIVIKKDIKDDDTEANRVQPVHEKHKMKRAVLIASWVFGALRPKTNAVGPQQVTLGPHQSCSRVESDTSLSAAMAAGVIALTLEAK